MSQRSRVPTIKGKEYQDYQQPRTQDLSLGKTLAAAGHVPRPKFSARGGVVKVSNYMLPVGYYMYVYKPLKT
jgi:hypothetical protein